MDELSRAPHRMRVRWRIPAYVWSALVGGAVSGLLGGLVFAAAHAILIVPIWSRMMSGLAFGALAGAAAGWALAELYPSVSATSLPSAITLGARFGATLWVIVAPVTAADALLRAVGVASRYELVAVGVALVLAVSAGAAFGWYRARRRRAVVAGAVATLTLVMAMAGPVPVARSARAFGIFLAVLPAAVLAGAVLAALVRSMSRAPAPTPTDLAAP